MATGVCGVRGLALVSDLSDLSDKMGAPVFALTGYAVASHVIPRGGAVPLCGMARGKMCRLGDYCNRRTNHTIS